MVILKKASSFPQPCVRWASTSSSPVRTSWIRPNACSLHFLILYNICVFVSWKVHQRVLLMCLWLSTSPQPCPRSLSSSSTHSIAGERCRSLWLSAPNWRRWNSSSSAFPTWIAFYTIAFNVCLILGFLLSSIALNLHLIISLIQQQNFSLSHTMVKNYLLPTFKEISIIIVSIIQLWWVLYYLHLFSPLLFLHLLQ